MNIIGHTGLTLGVAYAATPSFEALSNYKHGTESLETTGARIPITSVPAAPKTVKHLRIDYRGVLLGSLLPDIIDRPLAFW